MLEKFIWNEKYSVGVSTIDGQHQTFFQMVNDLIDFLNENKTDKNELMDLIGRLEAYSYYHLTYEENYYNLYHYIESDEHKREHDMYRSKIQEFKHDFLKEGADLNTVATELLNFAGSWLKQHILMTDSKASDFFKQHNIGTSLSYNIF
jgi:hemerythrin